MSGPKVVRIVTREEVIATCQRRLREVERALAAWQARAAMLGGLDDSDAAAMRQRLQRLRALLDQDRFPELQDAAKYELGFLDADLAEREQRAVTRAVEARAAARRRQDGRRALLAALNDQADHAAADIARRLRAAGDDALDAVLAEGYAWLSNAAATEHSATSEAARALARTLKDGNEAQSDRAGWLAEQAQALRDPRLQHIDRHIAELDVLAGASVAAPFRDRLALAEAEADRGRRQLLLDSLLLALADACRLDARLREQLAALRRLLAEAVGLVDAEAAAQLGSEVEQAATNRDLERVTALTRQCQALIEEAASAHAAEARREAVLNALADLGYEVHEGMATAWAQNGRLALRKAATPGYGVEVGGQAATGRMQMRAVAFDAQRDRHRDRDIEALWCSDFRQLQSAIDAAGGELAIERALAVGEVPLKDIESGSVALPSGRSTRPHRRHSH